MPLLVRKKKSRSNVITKSRRHSLCQHRSSAVISPRWTHSFMRLVSRSSADTVKQESRSRWNVTSAGVGGGEQGCLGPGGVVLLPGLPATSGPVLLPRRGHDVSKGHAHLARHKQQAGRRCAAAGWWGACARARSHAPILGTSLGAGGMLRRKKRPRSRLSVATGEFPAAGGGWGWGGGSS